MTIVTLDEFENYRKLPQCSNEEAQTRVNKLINAISLAELQEHAGQILAVYSDFETTPHMYWRKVDFPDRALLAGRVTSHDVDNLILKKVTGG